MPKQHPLVNPSSPIVRSSGVSHQYFAQWLADAERNLRALSEVQRGVNNPTNPALPASGTTVTNTNDFIVQVIIIGGNVTGVAINGVIASTKPISSLTVLLNPGDSIAITYSSAPDWFWKAIGV